MINDIVSDGLTRIRNAGTRKLNTTNLVHSNLMESVASILKDKGYISNFKIVGSDNKKNIKVSLKYNDNEETIINELVKVSKPGRRVYKNSNDIKSFKNGYGTLIISTSKGVLSNDDAFKLGIGGEVLCSVW